MQTKLTINGVAATHDVSPATLLVELLRDGLSLTGTHIGCDTSQCGACNVLIDGVAVKSCTVLAATLDGAKVTTIEGLAKGEELHPMQAAFKDNHGLQCGFCTPGMVMAGLEIVRRHGPNVSAETIAPTLTNFARKRGPDRVARIGFTGMLAYGFDRGGWLFDVPRGLGLTAVQMLRPLRRELVRHLALG